MSGIDSLLPGIGAAADFSSQALNAISTAATNRKQRKWAEKMYQRQRSDAVADWNAQNAYNAPIAQMQRLRDAGLNPNLVYGHGADAQSTSAIRSSSAPAYNPRPVEMQAGEAISRYFDVKQRAVQTDNLKAQNDVIHEQAAVLEMQKNKMGVDMAKSAASTAMTQFDLDKAKALYSNSLEQASEKLRGLQIGNEFKLSENERRDLLTKANLDRTGMTLQKGVAEIALMRARTGLTEEQVKEVQARVANLGSSTELNSLEAEMRKHGTSFHDALWQRTVAKKAEDIIDGVKNIGVPLVPKNLPGIKSWRETQSVGVHPELFHLKR